jgi:hypothetical protein
MIAANHGHLLTFDNLSGLPAWLSDALCGLASGGCFAARKLVTDDEEVLFQAASPILLNGIEDVISRPDLADRAIFLTLGPIAEQERRSETGLRREFEIARPRILGVLLDTAVQGLRLLDRVQVDRLPRKGSDTTRAMDGLVFIITARFASPLTDSLSPYRDDSPLGTSFLRRFTKPAIPEVYRPRGASNHARTPRAQFDRNAA